MLFSLRILGAFPRIFLLLIYNLIPLWSKHVLHMTWIFLNPWTWGKEAQSLLCVGAYSEGTWKETALELNTLPIPVKPSGRRCCVQVPSVLVSYWERGIRFSDRHCGFVCFPLAVLLLNYIVKLGYFFEPVCGYIFCRQHNLTTYFLIGVFRLFVCFFGHWR